MAEEKIELTVGCRDFVAGANAWSDAQIAAEERLPSLLDDRGTKTVHLAYCDTHEQMRAKSLTV